MRIILLLCVANIVSCIGLERLTYLRDDETNLCFATTYANTLMLVPCTPEVMRLADKVRR